MKLTQRIGVIAALLLPLTAGAAGGKGIAPNYPVIAGQYADYLAYALTQYRSGQRSNPIMMGIAAGLSDDDIADLAAYYAHLPGLSTPRK